MTRCSRGVRIAVAVFGALAIAAAGCTDSGDEPAGPATTSAPDEPMLVVDVEALPVEEQLTFAALQGIVNRERPTLVDAHDPSILYADYTPLRPLSPVVSFIEGTPIVRIPMATKPGDGVRTSTASVPISCTPTTAP